MEIIEKNLPVLIVLIPLISAPICVLLRHRTLAWLWASVASIATLIVAVWVAYIVFTTKTPITYELGGWKPPWGISYHIDAANALVLVIVAMVGALVLPFARASMERELKEFRVFMTYGMILLLISGLLGITITGDAFNVFVFMEIAALSSYALISMGNDRRALTAALSYLVMGTIGGTFVLIGIGLLYMKTGTLNMADLSVRLTPELLESKSTMVAAAFFMVGISIKLAMFPMHFWLPNAYAFAPSVVTALLAGTATKVAVYAMLRFVFGVFGEDFLFNKIPFDSLLLVLGAFAMVSMSAVAIFQSNIKRLFAYSSVAQLGYILLGIGLAASSDSGLSAGLIHLFNHALVKTSLFMALGAVFFCYGSTHIKALCGLGKRMPVTAAALVLGGLSLIGVPLTTGFISKWFLIKAAFEAEHVILVVLIVFSSMLAVAYVWKLVEVMYFQQPYEDVKEVVQNKPVMLVVSAWLLLLANVYFGIDSTVTAEFAAQASDALKGGFK